MVLVNCDHISIYLKLQINIKRTCLLHHRKKYFEIKHQCEEFKSHFELVRANCILQNKEKSIALKTMEDGQVLLYAVSFSH